MGKGVEKVERWSEKGVRLRGGGEHQGETDVEEIGRREECELSICMNPPLLRPTATCSAASTSYHRAEEPMITYTGAEHRGRVLMWYRSEDGHKNERQLRGSSCSVVARKTGRRADGRGRSFESSESSNRRADTCFLHLFCTTTT